MPTDHIRIISCPDFMRYDAGGKFDAAATRASLTQIASHCAANGVRDALLDVRQITTAPSIAELFWIADELPALGFSSLHRLAIVFTDHGQGRAKFFATAAHNHGLNIREFTDFEDAFTWLSTAAPAGEQAPARGDDDRAHAS